MTTTAEILTARWAEDEAIAVAATRTCTAPWRYVETDERAYDCGYVASSSRWDVTVHPDGRWSANGSVQDDECGRHIARHHPGRVLADIESKRTILALHKAVRYTNADLGIHDATVCITCHAVMDEPDDWPPDRDWSYPLVQVSYPCPTIRALLPG